MASPAVLWRKSSLCCLMDSKMFRALTFVLVLVVCANAFPAPSKPKVTLVKNSSFGLGLAGANGVASGTVEEKDRSFDVPVDTGDSAPDVTVLDNVNTGAAFAFAGGVTTGVSKNNHFS